MNVLRVGFALAIGVMVTGCASVGGVANKMVNNTQDGIIYGYSAVASDDTAAEKVCTSIANKDYRCKDLANYTLVTIWSKFGFADGVVGINALVRKDFPNLSALKHLYATGDKRAPYVKARVIPGQLGELLEVVSTNGDGKCYWSGMPRAGGVVCPAYNYDYRKDFTGVVFR